ncbi:Retrovirus-related Pol polyprotein from transposon RE2 [Cardamine amara subsp. amara]|uniref:Retrovirus-related Pol polyprotein from transposon RE2 n=1 Tax=Cardamine amara subsp. amara TaxID=228776 RepID=A0ABD1A404_CARAN
MPLWLLDTGTSNHVTTDLNNLALYSPYQGNKTVVIGDGSGHPITHTGSTSLSLSSHSIKLNHVLYVPNIDKNLMSVCQTCAYNNVSITFDPWSNQVRDLTTGTLLKTERTKNGMYEWLESVSSSTRVQVLSAIKTSMNEWHSRLSHPAFDILNCILSKCSLPFSNKIQAPLLCNSCSINKIHKLCFGTNIISFSRPLEVIYSDVWTSQLFSVDGHKYYLILVDHFTRYTWFYPLKRKSQVFETFNCFKELFKNRFQSRIVTFYSENGGEFMVMKLFLSNNGIAHRTSPPHTPEHNGISERKHRHIVETGLALLSHAHMPKEYWSFAFSTVVYFINRLPSSSLNLQVPFEILFQEAPNY